MAYKNPEDKKLYYQRNRDRICARQREYYKNNAEKRKEYWARYREINGECISKKKRRDFIRSQYGLDYKDYLRMFNEQGGKCAICGVAQENLGQNLCVDHDHKTGAIRGLLCKPCNVGLGHFKDSLDVMNRAMEYLKGNKAQ